MQILKELPPQALVTRLEAAGMSVDLSKTIFTYGDTIYNPTGHELPSHLVAHESIHAQQQRRTIGGAEMWWAAYLADPMFRLDQEAEAYGHQYAFFCKNKKSQTARLQLLSALGNMLAGETYGGMIKIGEATQLIQRLAQNEI